MGELILPSTATNVCSYVRALIFFLSGLQPNVK